MSQAGQSTNILSLVNNTIELPTLPEVLIKLNEVMEDPESSADDIAVVISKDPSVATNILRLVNSAHYGLQVRISAISLAISVLGFNMTRKVAMKAAVFSTFGKRRDKGRQFDAVGFWKHAISSGVAARTIGGISPVFAETHPEDLYIAGLLHDIGKIILLEQIGQDYLDLLQRGVGERRPDLELEREKFGFTHADVGSVLAIKWFLPEDLVIAIRYHHAPSSDPFHRSLSSLIHLSDQLSWQVGRPSTVGTIPTRLDPEAHEQIGMTTEQVVALLPQIQEDLAASELPW